MDVIKKGGNTILFKYGDKGHILSLLENLSMGCFTEHYEVLLIVVIKVQAAL